jgi:hypothetical protein
MLLPKVLAVRIAKRFEIDLKRYRAERTVEAAFAYLRGKVEEGGVFVLLLGNLGSHHTNIPVEFFRGFAISDKLATMIVINDQDTKSAWSFTAMHELVHLWLGKKLSGASTFSTKPRAPIFMTSTSRYSTKTIRVRCARATMASHPQRLGTRLSSAFCSR